MALGSAEPPSRVSFAYQPPIQNQDYLKNQSRSTWPNAGTQHFQARIPLTPPDLGGQSPTTH